MAPNLNGSARSCNVTMVLKPLYHACFHTSFGGMFEKRCPQKVRKCLRQVTMANRLRRVFVTRPDTSPLCVAAFSRVKKRAIIYYNSTLSERPSLVWKIRRGVCVCGGWKLLNIMFFGRFSGRDDVVRFVRHLCTVVSRWLKCA